MQRRLLPAEDVPARASPRGALVILLTGQEVDEKGRLVELPAAAPGGIDFIGGRLQNIAEELSGALAAQEMLLIGRFLVSVSRGHHHSDRLQLVHEEIKERIEELMSIPVVVKNKNEQNASFFRLMNIEKWISYAVVSLTLIIVSFNLVSALWMIVLDKKKDISILQSMGAAPVDVKKIFMRSGWLICFIGLFTGVMLAVFFYYLQKTYGIVPIPEGFVVDSYPIELRWRDILIVGATVFFIGTLGSLLPANKASRIAAYIRKE